MGRTYLIQYANGTTEEKLIDDPREYWELLDNADNIINVEEIQRVGRDLATYGVEF
jgi:hypothetical protein